MFIHHVSLKGKNIDLTIDYSVDSQRAEVLPVCVRAEVYPPPAEEVRPYLLLAELVHVRFVPVNAPSRFVQLDDGDSLVGALVREAAREIVVQPLRAEDEDDVHFQQQLAHCPWGDKGQSRDAISGDTHPNVIPENSDTM